MVSAMPEQVAFEFDWQAADTDVRSRELAATWARLQISVDGEYLTVVEDLDTRSVRRTISVALYPLAEWVAYNWWRLLFETKKGLGGSHPEGLSLRSVSDGFTWPNLSFRTEGGYTKLAWHADRLTHSGWSVRYVTSGQAFLSTVQLRQSLEGVVEATLARLDEVGVSDTPLHKEWAALKNLDEEEAEFCQACGRLGLDPFLDGPEFADQIAAAFEQLDTANRDDFFDTVEPNNLHPGLEWVRASLDQAQSAVEGRAGNDLFRPLDRRILFDLPTTPTGDEPPWAVGYRQAVNVRAALDMPATRPLQPTEFPVVILEGLPAPDSGLQGVTVPANHVATLVLGWHASPPSRLFAVARGTWALLTNAGPATLITTAHSYRQQVSRAFAAELLAPAEGIKAITGGRRQHIWPATIADHFGVNEIVITHQLENQLR